MTVHVPEDEREPPGDRPRPPAPAPEHELNPLQHLIQQRLRERGWSYGEVARRGGLPRSTVYTLAMTRNLARPPRPATLDGLAKGLDVPVSAVRAAAAESTGLHYSRGPRRAAGSRRPRAGAADRQHRRADPRRPRHVAALVDRSARGRPRIRRATSCVSRAAGPAVSERLTVRVTAGPPTPAAGWAAPVCGPGRGRRPGPARGGAGRRGRAGPPAPALSAGIPTPPARWRASPVAWPIPRTGPPAAPGGRPARLISGPHRAAGARRPCHLSCCTSRLPIMVGEDDAGLLLRRRRAGQFRPDPAGPGWGAWIPACCRRRRLASSGSVGAASQDEQAYRQSRSFSHCGMPAETGGPWVTGCG